MQAHTDTQVVTTPKSLKMYVEVKSEKLSEKPNRLTKVAGAVDAYYGSHRVF